MKKHMTIAIDGPSAAGKSTIAKMIAKIKKYTYIDTGAMYRCVALYCYQQGIDVKDEKSVEAVLNRIDITMDSDNKVYLNDQDVSLDIRQDAISLMASTVSQYQAVRQYLVQQQRQMASSKDVILDGRDVGTIVLPDARLKIYQIASVETRAMRRYKENIERGMDVSLETITKEIEQRDYQDTHRDHSPLKKAQDAIELDTSHLSLDEVVEEVLKLIEQVEGE